MVCHPNDFGTLKPLLLACLNSAVELVPVLVELVQQPVVEVDEPVLLVEVPVLVVMVVVVVKVHWRFQNFLVNPELSWL